VHRRRTTHEASSARLVAHGDADRVVAAPGAAANVSGTVPRTMPSWTHSPSVEAGWVKRRGDGQRAGPTSRPSIASISIDSGVSRRRPALRRRESRGRFETSTVSTTRWKKTYVGESSHARAVTTGPFVATTGAEDSVTMPRACAIKPVPVSRSAVAFVEALLGDHAVAIEDEDAGGTAVDVARVRLDAVHSVVSWTGR